MNDLEILEKVLAKFIKIIYYCDDNKKMGVVYHKYIKKMYNTF
ncbi:MAG: hypothetical protein ACI4VQ_04575 [Clostridia bacterium]